MKGFYTLTGCVKQYDWGDPAQIPRLLGIPHDAGSPCAEWWLGSHPAGASLARAAFSAEEAPPEKLDALIASDPPFFLGPRAPEGRLPFLLKILAVKKPLSVQAHPNAAQAQAGWARENALGIPLDAPRRNYKDPNHKPEMVCALTPFTALCGFRPLSRIERLLTALPCAALRDLLPGLSGGGGEAASYRRLLSFLGGLDSGAREELTACILSHTDALAARHPEDAGLWAMCASFARACPGDPAVIAPLYLNKQDLAPGEAFFVPAGVPHAYVSGMAVECMAASDNVLRGGLTSKYVDTPELLRVLRLAPFAPKIERAPATLQNGGIYRYPCDAPFSVSVIEHAESAPLGQSGPLLAALTGGECRLSLDGGKEELLITPGTGLFVAAGAPVERARVSVRGRLYLAGERL